MIYLDTSAVIWLYKGDLPKFPKPTIRLMEKNALVISPIVNLELVYLNEIKRLVTPAKEVFEYLKEKIELEICNIPFQDVIGKATEMTWTRDPFDRIITAQAALGSEPLVTKDASIRTHYENALWD